MDYHLYIQRVTDSGIFICYKCTELFGYQCELDCHLLKHLENPGHKCNYCFLIFLTRKELNEHNRKTDHDKKTDTKDLIKVHKELTIVNEVPPGPIPQRRKYTEVNKIMKLPKTPSNTPMHLPGHKPFRLELGAFQFDDTWNCAGTQKNCRRNV